MSLHGTSQWRWLLVLPAFLFGYVVVGFLVRVLWEGGSSWIPGIDFLMMHTAEFLQHVVDGFCAVFFAGYVAPSRAMTVRLVATTMIVVFIGGFLIYSLFTGYFRIEELGLTAEISWEIVLWVTQIIAAIVAAGTYASRSKPPKPPSIEEELRLWLRKNT